MRFSDRRCTHMSRGKIVEQANDRDQRSECLSNAVEPKIILKTRETNDDTHLSGL